MRPSGERQRAFDLRKESKRDAERPQREFCGRCGRSYLADLTRHTDLAKHREVCDSCIDSMILRSVADRYRREMEIDWVLELRIGGATWKQIEDAIGRSSAAVEARMNKALDDYLDHIYEQGGSWQWRRGWKSDLDFLRKIAAERKSRRLESADRIG